MNKKAVIFGLDVGTRNFEVLGRILASIFGVLGGLGVVLKRLEPHLERLGLHFAAKIFTRRQPHGSSKKLYKNRVQKTGVGGMKRFVWGYGEMHNSGKNRSRT